MIPVLKTIDDIQVFAKNVERFYFPKVDDAFIDQLNCFIEEHTKHKNEIGSSIIATILDVTLSMLDRALQLYTYSSNERFVMAKGLTLLAENVLRNFPSSIARNSDGKRLIAKFTETLLPAVSEHANSPEIALNPQSAAQIVHLFCREDLSFTTRKSLLNIFMEIIRKSSKKQRMAILVSDPSLLNLLINTIPTCGEWEFQELLTDLFLTFCLSRGNWNETLSLLLSTSSTSPVFAEAAKHLKVAHFQITLRPFLNTINASQPVKIRIHSLPCITAMADGIELQKPNGYDVLWVDCNPRTGDIQLLIDDVDGWARVVVEFPWVESIVSDSSSVFHAGESTERCSMRLSLRTGLLLTPNSEEPIFLLTLIFNKDNRFFEAEKNFFKVHYSQSYKVSELKRQHNSNQRIVADSLTGRLPLEIRDSSVSTKYSHFDELLKRAAVTSGDPISEESSVHACLEMNTRSRSRKTCETTDEHKALLESPERHISASGNSAEQSNSNVVDWSSLLCEIGTITTPSAIPTEICEEQSCSTEFNIEHECTNIEPPQTHDGDFVKSRRHKQAKSAKTVFSPSKCAVNEQEPKEMPMADSLQSQCNAKDLTVPLVESRSSLENKTDPYSFVEHKDEMPSWKSWRKETVEKEKLPPQESPRQISVKRKLFDNEEDQANEVSNESSNSAKKKRERMFFSPSFGKERSKLKNKRKTHCKRNSKSARTKVIQRLQKISSSGVTDNSSKLTENNVIPSDSCQDKIHTVATEVQEEPEIDTLRARESDESATCIEAVPPDDVAAIDMIISPVKPILLDSQDLQVDSSLKTPKLLPDKLPKTSKKRPQLPHAKNLAPPQPKSLIRKPKMKTSKTADSKSGMPKLNVDSENPEKTCPADSDSVKISHPPGDDLFDQLMASRVQNPNSVKKRVRFAENLIEPEPFDVPPSMNRNRVPDKPCTSSNVQNGTHVSNIYSPSERLSSTIDEILDNVKTCLKAYVEKERQNTSNTLSEMKKNVKNLLESHAKNWKLIVEETKNIAKSAANIENACETDPINSNVVLGMIKNIEAQENEAFVAASLKNNDPRSFSELREGILAKLKNL